MKDLGSGAHGEWSEREDQLVANAVVQMKHKEALTLQEGQKWKIFHRVKEIMELKIAPRFFTTLTSTLLGSKRWCPRC